MKKRIVLNAVSTCCGVLNLSFSNLFEWCSEEIRGEVLFVLYKLSVLQSTSAAEGDGSELLIPFCPKLLYLLGDVLLKTQNDDVRLNCIGTLSIFQYFCSL